VPINGPLANGLLLQSFACFRTGSTLLVSSTTPPNVVGSSVRNRVLTGSLPTLTARYGDDDDGAASSSSSSSPLRCFDLHGFDWAFVLSLQALLVPQGATVRVVAVAAADGRRIERRISFAPPTLLGAGGVRLAAAMKQETFDGLTCLSSVSFDTETTTLPAGGEETGAFMMDNVIVTLYRK
jgi:hypothetical protein